MLAGLTDDGRVLLWHTDAPGKPFVLDAGGRIITSVRFIPGDERFVTGDRSGIIDIWNTDAQSTGQFGRPSSGISCHSLWKD